MKIETIIEALKIINDFNSLDLETVDMVWKDEPLNIPEKLIKRWKYIGIPNIEILNNLDDLEKLESNYLGKLL
jgi:hypothetical protein